MISEYNAQAFLRTGTLWTALVVALFALVVVSLWSFKISGFEIASVLEPSSSQVVRTEAAERSGQPVGLQTVTNEDVTNSVMDLPRTTSAITETGVMQARDSGREESSGSEEQINVAELERLEAEALQQAQATEEAARLAAQVEAEEAARRQAQAEAEEAARLAAQAEAEEAARRQAQAEAEEAARLAAQAAAEEAARRQAQAEAEEAARLAAQAAAEEAARRQAQAEAEEAARLAAQAEAEEAARRQAQAEAEEAARLAAQAAAEEAARRQAQAEAEEAARLAAQAEADAAEGTRLATQATRIPAEVDEVTPFESQTESESATREQARVDLPNDSEATEAPLTVAQDAQIPAAQAGSADSEISGESDNTAGPGATLQAGGELVSLDTLAQAGEVDSSEIDVGGEPVRAPLNIGARPVEVLATEPIATVERSDDTDELPEQTQGPITVVLDQEISDDVGPDVALAEGGAGVTEALNRVPNTDRVVALVSQPQNFSTSYTRQREEELKILRGQSARIRFKPGSAEITSELEQPLDRIFDPLFLYAEVPIFVAVSVNEFEGGAEDYALSQDRGNAVVDYLVERGLEQNRFTVVVNPGEPLAPGTHRVTVSTKDLDQ